MKKINNNYKPGEVLKKQITERQHYYSSFKSSLEKELFDLKQSKSLLDSIIDSTKDLIWSVDPQRFNLLTFNRSLEIFLNEKDIHIKKGMNLAEVLPQESAKMLNKLYKETLQQGTLTTEYQTKLGDRTYLINLQVLSGENKPFAISVFVKDVTEKKLIGKTLEESEERYRLLFENSGEAFLLTNPNGSIYSANNEACRIFGMSEDEILELGRNGIIDLTDPRLEPALEERRKTGKFRGELNLLRKDGTKFPAEITTTTFRDTSGNERTSMFIRDISDRRKAESALNESEARFRTLFENSLIGISTATLDGKLLQVNLAFAMMYGYQTTELMLDEVKNIGMLYANPEERKEVLRILQRDGRFEAREFEVVRQDGSHFFVLVSASEIRDTEGKLLYMQATHIDLTERIKSEEKVRTAALYARNLIETSLDPLVTISAQGKITDVNSATERITGIKRNKLIGNEFVDYVTEPDKARLAFRKVFSKGVLKDYPITILHKSGRTTEVLYNASLFKKESGEIQGVFASAHDITRRKKTEEELRNSQHLLEKLNQHLHEIWENEKSQIALNLHDDLGQKLTALYLDIAWITSRIGVQSKVVRKKLKEMSLMISETIDGIKEFSSLLRPSLLFDLGLVPAISAQLIKFEKQYGIKCQFNYKPEEIAIDNRISLVLYRILQEALTNIARHSGASNTEANLFLSKNKIVMIIKDNGKGIDKDKINSLTSMGIAGIIERAKLVNGRVLIEGQKESGTTINVSIPLINVKKHVKSTDY